MDHQFIKMCEQSPQKFKKIMKQPSPWNITLLSSKALHIKSKGSVMLYWNYWLDKEGNYLSRVLKRPALLEEMWLSFLLHWLFGLRWNGSAWLHSIKSKQ